MVSSNTAHEIARQTIMMVENDGLDVLDVHDEFGLPEYINDDDPPVGTYYFRTDQNTIKKKTGEDPVEVTIVSGEEKVENHRQNEVHVLNQPPQTHVTTHEAGGSDPITLGNIANMDPPEVLVDTAANRPAAGTADRLYVETDTGTVYRDDGASWNVMGTTNIADTDHTASDHEAGGSLALTLGNIANMDPVEFVVTTAANLPAAGTTDRIAFETDTGRVLRDDGTAWQEMGLSESQIALGNLSSKAHSELSDAPTGAHHTMSNVVGFTADTAANLPAAGTAGRIFFETDTGRVLRDNGTSWIEMGLSESQISLANLSSRSHSDLSDAPAAAHHTKTTDMDDLNDVTGIVSFEENTSANRPAAGTEGRIFFESDTGRVLYDDGAAWQEIGLAESQISLANLSSRAHSDLSDAPTGAHHSATDHESGGALEITFSNIASVDPTSLIITTAANLPAAGTADRIAFETDTGRVLRDDGTTWQEVGLSESQISLANLSSNAHSDLSTAPSGAHHTKTTDMADMSDITGVTSFEENTSANRPAAGTEGRIFFETDTGRVLYDDGAAWVEIGLAESQISLANLSSRAHADLSDAPEGAHHQRGGFIQGNVTSTSHTASVWDSLWVDTSAAGGNVTVTLPSESNVSDNDRVRVAVEDATNSTSVSANTNQTIVGDNPSLTSVGASRVYEYRASDSTWMATQ